MKHILIFTIFLSNQLFGQTNNEVFNSFLKLEQTQPANIAFVVQNLSAKQNDISFNSNKLLYPASLQKIITTSTALNVLTKDFRFITDIVLKGEQIGTTFKGVLEISASGDPSLGLDFIDKTYAFLKAKGINKFEGYISVNQNKFDNTLNQSWLIEDIANYYGSPSFGFNFLANTYLLTFAQATESNTPKILSTYPKMKKLQFDNQVVCKGKRDLAYILGLPFSNERLIVGSIPAGVGTFIIKGAIDNPAQIFKNMLINKLKTENFNFTFNASVASGKTIYTKQYASDRLEILLKETNQKSNNLYAEALLKKIGLHKKGLGSTENGINAIEEYYHNTNTLIYDGSGLSRKNMLSATFLVDVLNQVKDNQVFINSLGISGVSGTMKYLTSENIKGKIHAKSGSADGVLNYAGFFKNDKGEQIAFVFMINNYVGSRSLLRKEMVKVLESFF